jgi:hypothetical protein
MNDEPNTEQEIDMLDKVTNPVLSVTEFPWITDPVDMKTHEEHAYMCGQHIARTRALLDDDNENMIINWGAGPGNRVGTLVVEHANRDQLGPFGIFTAITPDDLDLYRRILPPHFSMPDRPVLSLVNLDYNQPNPIVRYKEGMVMLNGVGADGEEAWYVHSMPVETWLMLVMGHDWGFRKDLFDMTVTREKTTVTQKDGDLYMSLELTDTPCPAETQWLVPREACGGTNNMAVIYPRKPDLMLRFGWTGNGVVLDDETRMVRITVNRALDWAGLVPEGTVAPGFYQRYMVDGGDAYIKKVRSA